LLETELFGHERGAFTGAVNNKTGLLEIAHKGTVFLDEIGDVDLQVQPKLLKVLEEKQFRRLGDVRDRRVDIRLIAATHQDMARLVRDKTFRSDLYFRISTIPITFPPLPARKEDIPVLAEHLIEILTSYAGDGVILSLDPLAQIVDITHDIPPQDITAAGFNIFACYRDFPRGTINVCVVDPGVGSDRRAILAVTDEYYFIAPDNGLLSFIYAAEPEVKVFELNKERFFRTPVSRTFHGRDVFAPVAGWLSKGAQPEELGDPITDFVRFEIAAPVQVGGNGWEGEIVYIDRFGNCVTNFDKQLLPENFHLEINGKKIARRQNFYAEGGHDGLFMIFGSTGLLEVSAYKSSAREILGIGAGEKVRAYINS